MNQQEVAPSGVANTRELWRIMNLPRRTWTDDYAFAEELSRSLRRPGGTMTLFPIQAFSLWEAWNVGGLFGGIGTGLGKTLLAFLLFTIFKSRRPLLFEPAKLIKPKQDDLAVLAKHWPIVNNIRFFSYELLGRIQSADMLDTYQPDLIVGDEAHKLANLRAACTLRVRDYVKKTPTRVCWLTGSPSKDSIKDDAHLIEWALGEKSPLPLKAGELEEWAGALDEKVIQRRPAGYLRALMTEEERADPDTLRAARSAYRRRLTETPGVVITSENEVGASLTIQPIEFPMRPEIDEAFRKLRKDWETPAGESLLDMKTQVWACARQLSLGLFYTWDPAAPKPWRERRKVCGSWIRYIATTNRRNLYSELQVIRAIDEGLYPEAEEPLRAWREIKDSFKPNTVAVWLDDAGLKACYDWSKGGPGIIWTDHVPFAERLSELTGFPYYGAGGVARDGSRIPEYDNPRCGVGVIIASAKSGGEGLNLQRWSRNLITSGPTNGRGAEQLLARTHRTLQAATEVVFDTFMQSWEQWNGWQSAIAGAQFIESTKGQRQKLLYADNLLPKAAEVFSRREPRWFG